MVYYIQSLTGLCNAEVVAQAGLSQLGLATFLVLILHTLASAIHDNLSGG